ncbi:PREDICTED: uncharacterized protein LOC102853038 [Elephantulus edwardii]|uniref:uncharacterized protein LOC102853038 n=1 Tax=Elephantulus edwardii TaxID=28737 RepID=UPI0003F0ED7B|nr:PREDICTED: uncharacterized protein LOC102853038 [Elephantulus edwardii]
MASGKEALVFEKSPLRVKNYGMYRECQVQNDIMPDACDQPPQFPGMVVKDSRESYSPGDTAQYECRIGYKRRVPLANMTIVCQENNTWPVVADGCRKDLLNGRIEFLNGNLLLGTQIKYIFAKCPPPPKIDNGKYSNVKDVYAYHEVVHYSCNPTSGDEFSLIGNRTLICSSETKWSSDPPKCKVVKCPFPTVENGEQVSGFGKTHSYKAQVTFKCLSGFFMDGHSTVVCEEDNAWVPEIPKCVKAPETDDKGLQGTRLPSHETQYRQKSGSHCLEPERRNTNVERPPGKALPHGPQVFATQVPCFWLTLTTPGDQYRGQTLSGDHTAQGLVHPVQGWSCVALPRGPPPLRQPPLRLRPPASQPPPPAHSAELAQQDRQDQRHRAGASGNASKMAAGERSPQIRAAQRKGEGSPTLYTMLAIHELGPQTWKPAPPPPRPPSCRICAASSMTGALSLPQQSKWTFLNSSRPLCSKGAPRPLRSAGRKGGSCTDSRAGQGASLTSPAPAPRGHQGLRPARSACHPHGEGSCARRSCRSRVGCRPERSAAQGIAPQGVNSCPGVLGNRLQAKLAMPTPTPARAPTLPPRRHLPRDSGSRKAALPAPRGRHEMRSRCGRQLHRGRFPGV